MINSISVPFKKVRRVIHVADLHIRLYQRHKEYLKVFERWFEELQKTDLSETVIVVAGDIVHSKTDLSPEMVALTSYFLLSCAKLVPTLVIAGNHDMNLANPDRMDALSPICDNIQS
jgi:DNA repair exonuclease SbcCD nuclease subunit